MRLFRLNIGSRNFHNFAKCGEHEEIFKRSWILFGGNICITSSKAKSDSISAVFNIERALVSLFMARFRGPSSLVVCLLFSRISRWFRFLFLTATKFCVKCLSSISPSIFRLHSSWKWMNHGTTNVSLCPLTYSFIHSFDQRTVQIAKSHKSSKANTWALQQSNQNCTNAVYTKR